MIEPLPNDPREILRYAMSELQRATLSENERDSIAYAIVLIRDQITILEAMRCLELLDRKRTQVTVSTSLWAETLDRIQ